MHITEIFHWPLAAIMFVAFVIFTRNIFMEGNKTADYVSHETNVKTLVYEDRSNLSSSGYKTRQILIEGSSIVSDIISTEESVSVVINNASGLPNTLTEDERKSIRSKGNVTPILERINTSRKYTKIYSFNKDGVLSRVEYTMN